MSLCMAWCNERPESKNQVRRRIVQGMIRRAIVRIVAALLAGIALVTPASAFDYEQLMKLKKDFEVVRDIIRKLRGRDPAPPPPSPPESTQPPDAPVAGLTFTGNGVAKDETGYTENAQFRIADGKVGQLSVRIEVPKRGACRYQLAAFKQVKSTPFVELQANSNAACTVRVWHQADRVTLAATDCADKCAPGAFDYAWPVEFQVSGGCH